MREGASLNDEKVRLADHVTLLAHGQKGLDQAKQKTQALFQNASPETIPPFDLNKIAGQEPYTLLDILEATGFVSSRSEARRLIRSGAIRLDGKILSSEYQRFKRAPQGQKPCKLSLGKKKHVLLEIGNFAHLGQKIFKDP